MGQHTDESDLIADDRFNYPFPTERYQPWDRHHALQEKPLPTEGNPQALLSTAAVGPTGVGVAFEWAEPIWQRQYAHTPWEVPPVAARTA